jgi:dihydrodiol dehydrogenase / D-xylose 1-dehydrogenase (NADP)
MVAIAARNLSSAKQFAEKHNISKAYGSYEELAKDPEVQVVYVGVINTVHFNVTLLMLEHGKHLLVEKPLGMNAKGLLNLIFLHLIINYNFSNCLNIFNNVRK